jgi:hypothetical protein
MYITSHKFESQCVAIERRFTWMLDELFIAARSDDSSLLAKLICHPFDANTIVSL